MNLTILRSLACVGLSHAAAFAQSADRAQNFSRCMNGSGACDHSTLSQPEAELPREIPEI
jgi:hypothetical protein